ncbi:enoyl-CoA hydratase-related protein [Sphingomonas floccifaciens]|uniref:Enoyl-CoA hydratase-related protein n=1 Tax=Sphingomonas floccifaciens TaxID=1844115 RepID=A0ABW4NHU4_9SPHN
MTEHPVMTQFRIEQGRSGIVHLVFDCPGRTMNVFSEAAIADIGTFAAWLTDADVPGVVIRSGKDNAFCAGADLTELGVAYDMIVAAPERRRFDLAYDHFFPLSRALRALETSGKPVVAAIAGLALGGGCELALAAHHRVLVDDPRIGLGLPESLVGLLPGAGGTQRLPRLIGIEAALPILMEGARLSGQVALDTGLVGTLVAAGEEIEAAEAWVLANPASSQPWDGRNWQPAELCDVHATISIVRDRVLQQTQGHYPAPLAILDCIELGLPQAFDAAIRTEMAIFAQLIQREEPRNMIATMFLAKTEYERLRRKGELPPALEQLVAIATSAIAAEDRDTIGPAGFGGGGQSIRRRSENGYWIDTEFGREARTAIDRIDAAIVADLHLPPEYHSIADYAVVVGAGYPAYLGGPYARLKRAKVQ